MNKTQAQYRQENNRRDRFTATFRFFRVLRALRLYKHQDRLVNWLTIRNFVARSLDEYVADKTNASATAPTGNGLLSISVQGKTL